MSLTFGGATSDRVNYGSNAVLDNLSTHTVIMWIYPTTLTAGKVMFNKEADTQNAGGVNGLRVAATTSELRNTMNQVTTNSNYISSNAGITVNKWWFVCYTYDDTATPRSKIYRGDLGTIVTECTYGTTTVGVGTKRADATKSLLVGNEGSLTNAFQGSIAFVAEWNRVLTLGEIRDQQFRPHITSGCVFFSYPGFGATSGLGTQIDLSGNNNQGTITGATLFQNAPTTAPFA